MKRAKKLMSLCLALVMAIGMAVGAMAAGEGSITVTDSVEGQKYTVYKILDLESYNATTGAYLYKASTAWSDFINSGEIKETYVNVDANGYVTWVEGASAADFAAKALQYATDNKITNQGQQETAEGATTVKFDNLELGYYLVDSTAGALCALTTAAPDATITEKNEQPTVEKEVQEGENWGEENDGDIGDTVNFRATITARDGAQNYVLHDKMSSGLTFTGVTGITLNNTTVDASNYTVIREGLTDGCAFEVRFTKAFCDTLKDNDKIVVTYTATINENAVVGSAGNDNKVHLDYGDDDHPSSTPDDETKTYTWTFNVFKFAITNGKETSLAGATFTLSTDENGSNKINLIKTSDNVYRVAKADETTDIVTEITTDNTGTFTINGLDSGTYYLTETQNPAGYNKLSAPVKIVIAVDGKIIVNNGQATTDTTVKVENKSGSSLPETGGMGTTLFYIIGGVLVIGAGVLLVTKKRMGAGK